MQPIGTAEDPAVAALAFPVDSRNREMCRQIERSLGVAAMPYTVLIEGETGTGKEIFARAIHAASERSGPFVPVNCSAVPETMFEAEVFGAWRGAYTGLNSDRTGLYRLADGGTLFLDEVGDLPGPMQAKLLRVLEDGHIRPLGGDTTVRVDVRVLAATLKPLMALVDAGTFRRDLYFRLSQACIRLPPLRQRREDLPTLIEEAVREACALQGVSPRRVDNATLGHLLEYEWPGNVRELKNVIAVAVMGAKGELIEQTDLPARVSGCDSHGDEDIAVRSQQPFFDALEAFRRSGLSRASVRSKGRRYGLLDGSAADAGGRSRVRFPTE